MYFPTYEELKEMKDYKCYHLYFPIIGGYFKITRNENGNDISLDYLEGGYLSYINHSFLNDSVYKLNKLYKFNKKNYTNLVKLYVKILENSYNDIKEELSRYKEVK